MVSIPYRLATNLQKLQITLKKGDEVSIPYRLATNVDKYLNARAEMYFVSIPYRLATNQRPLTLGALYLSFQFLIGWLQTIKILTKQVIASLVSIPYRLATN